MGITIQQYRCRIGSFLPKNISFRSSNKLCRNEDSPTDFCGMRRNIFMILLLAGLTILFVVSPIQSSTQSYSHPLNPALPGCSNFLQNIYQSTNPRPGSITREIAATYLIQYGMNTLAATSFRMVTNFQSRYVNGNRKNSESKLVIRIRVLVICRQKCQKLRIL